MGLLSRIIGPSRSSLQATIDAQKAAISTMVRAKYDAAQTSDLNRNHWSRADNLSADAGLQPHVRQTLRNRARYELRNNSYAAGIASTWSNDLVGTGPRLQLDLGPGVSPDAVRAVETQYFDWSDRIDLARKLRIAKTSKISDGEVFGLKVSNSRLRGVQLDLRLVEADQVVSPVGYLTENDVDGVRFDDDWNVTDYWVAKTHPGSLLPGFTLDGEWISADYVCHWYHATRPGQHRGVPEIAPALELFALLRRYTLAVVTAAETAASFAAILKTTMPADGSGAASLETLETMPIVRGMAIAAPDGWEPVQMRAEHPTASHDAFVRRLINEIAAALGMPYIVASLDSSAANYSSMRGDYLVYRKRIAVERCDMERVFLDPLLMSWLDEAVDAGILPRGLPPFASWNWTWTWDGFEHVDPLKEADADAAMVNNNMASLAEVCAKRGRDWRVVLRQRAAEKSLELELGVSAEPAAAAAADDEDGIEAEDGYRPPQAARAAARRGLELRREYGRGGTAVGVARARDIANGRSLSLDTIGRMVSYFARHEVDKQGQGWSEGEKGYPSAGKIAWLCWGGDAGRSWANRVYKRETEAADA